MPAIAINEATERLASAIENAPFDDLVEYYAEMYPSESRIQVGHPKATNLAELLVKEIRAGLEPETIVDLWNVVYPRDRNVHFDEEDDVIRFNERVLNYAD